MKKWGNILLRKKNVERLIIFNNQFLCPTYTNSSKYWSNSGQFTTSSTKVRKNKHTEKSLIFFKKKNIFPIFRSDCWSSRKIKKFLYSRWLLAILRIKKFLIMRVDWLFILPSKLSELHKKRFTSKKTSYTYPEKLPKFQNENSSVNYNKVISSFYNFFSYAQPDFIFHHLRNSCIFCNHVVSFFLKDFYIFHKLFYSLFRYVDNI